VFDPLAVLLLIASQYTFEFNRRPEDDDGERLRLEREEYEQARAQRIVDNVPPDNDIPTPPEEEEVEDKKSTTEEVASDYIEKKELESSEELSDLDQWNNWVAAAEAEAQKEEMQKRIQRVQELEDDEELAENKRKWKKINPGKKIKEQKNMYVRGMIQNLPWEEEVIEPEGYTQNEEQSDNSIWNRIKRDSE
jgi:hypothetical protein